MLAHMFGIFLTLLNFSYCGEILGDVIFVSVLWRHGDRTPDVFYPNDPYASPVYWPEGFAQLTDTGKRQQYELGKFLRTRYDKLIPRKYHVNDVYVRCSDVDRTLMSASSNMAGFYEPTGNMTDNWNPLIDWEPVPIHGVPQEEDDMIGNGKLCPKWNAGIASILTKEPFKTIEQENKNLFAKLSKETGMPIVNLVQVERLADTLYIERKKNLPLPPWTVGIFPEKISALSDYAYTLNCFTPQLARLRIGNLIKDMVKHMQQKRAKVLFPDRKAWFYSGHETTVGDLLQGLRMFDVHNPPYAAAVMVELRQLNSDYFVSIYYRNSTVLPPVLLTLPSCTAYCPLDKFIKIVTPIMPIDRQKECDYINPITGYYDPL